MSTELVVFWPFLKTDVSDSAEWARLARVVTIQQHPNVPFSCPVPQVFLKQEGRQRVSQNLTEKAEFKKGRLGLFLCNGTDVLRLWDTSCFRFVGSILWDLK
ncbi:hypothetical protein OUZ56_020836 [Daphnia magna]|uniref:Uncharacterized protein n=1 Tax=Daphnia magna TaxID=35525 RepID=A0ABQ9ZFK7_9CRUS|nr:hypothetical protein OUZ56_020836 [Daphnia magna]